MTDKELLELAAKAAGITLGEYWTPHLGRHHDHCWNPLTDDGDALRLAVQLNILKNAYLESWIAQEVGKGLDWYAATRRAIVMAAAQIGRAMP
jgi:hypothetical protein